MDDKVNCFGCKNFNFTLGEAEVSCVKDGLPVHTSVHDPVVTAEVCSLFEPAPHPVSSAPMHEKIRTLGRALADLVSEKNQAYGSSFEKSGEFLRILYPDGLRPEQYGDALLLVRIFDKQMRIATRKDAFGESPFKDIAGYGLIGAAKDDKP